MRLLCVILCLCATTVFADDASKADPDALLVDVAGLVDGRDLSDYANDWWQWAYSMPQSESPLRDMTGDKCGVNQEAAVWFLAGGFGSSKIARRCTVPADTHIFFPIINMVEYTPPGSRRTCAQVIAAASANNDRYVQLRATLNGQQFSGLDQYRVASRTCFDLLERVPPEFEPPSYAPAATDGYWLMLKPLPAGEHRLQFQAFYTNEGASFGGMVQNIRYDLTVLSE